MVAAFLFNVALAERSLDTAMLSLSRPEARISVQDLLKLRWEVVSLPALTSAQTLWTPPPPKK